jgi:hypothetical protein
MPMGTMRHTRLTSHYATVENVSLAERIPTIRLDSHWLSGALADSCPAACHDARSAVAMREIGLPALHR